MKNFFKSLAICALAALTFASCQKENADGNMDDQSSVVSINLTSPLMGTKAFADGNTVNVVHVHVYKVGEHGALTYIEPGRTGSTATPSQDVEMNGGRATYSTRLVTGQTYTFVFWAEQSGNGHYTYNPTNQTIAVNYASATGNDESRDAFYAVLKNVKITGAYSQSVTLTRPFAQVNFGVTTADMAAANAAGITVNKAAVECTNVRNQLNLLTGTVSGSEDVAFASAVLPSETLSAANKTYKYVAMNYVLVGKDASTLSNITLTLNATGAVSATPKYTYTNVPLQGNYRTNIVGDLFTSPASINITVDKNFEGENNEVIQNVSSIAAANTALTNGATNINISNITASEANRTKLQMPATPESITIAIENIESTANLQIEKPNNDSHPASVAVTIPSSASVNQLTINLPQSHVEINGASYNSINATTSNNTLVIGRDVTVQTLTLEAGNCIVYGKVNTLKRGESNPNAYIEYHIYDKLALKKAVGSQQANKVILENDITFADYTPSGFDSDYMSKTLTAPEITVDLNGHSIKRNGGSILKLSKGTISFVGRGVIENYMPFMISGSTTSTDENYSVLTIGPDITVKGSVCLFVNQPKSTYNNYGIVVNCNNKFELTTDGMAATVNGTNTVTEGNVPIFNFDGASITGGAIGIYAAGYAKWNLKNTNITGKESAIEVRAGEVTIDGGEYKATNTPFSITPEGSGTTINGAALGISQHTTDLPINVVVNSGTFTGEHAIHEEDVQNETGRESIKLTVNGGTFNGAIYSQNNPNAIVKGTYSDPAVLHYLAEGADVKIKMTADNEIASEVSVSQKAEINLNDHKLKVSAYFSTIGSGSLAISNGSIECVDLSGNNPQIRSYGSSHMSFDDVKMTSNGSAVYVGEECNFTIKNSTIEAQVFGISTNASDPNQNPTINVENCQLTGGDPILVNIPCALTVKQSRIQGMMHGVVVRGGTALFKECAIKLNYNGSDAETMAHYFDKRNWGQGNEINLAALTIGNKSSTAYQYPTNVTLEKTNVIVEGDNAEYFPALYAYANSGEGLGVTLTYDSETTFTGGLGAVYGSNNIVVTQK